ncbi:MAG: nitroreductase family protein [Desulfotalea sp.]
MVEFKVDVEKCIGCGQCVVDCPVIILSMVDGIPVLAEKKNEFCISCMHCFAVCSEGAVTMNDHVPSDDNILDKKSLPTSKQMATLIKGRRSVRRYQDGNVGEDVIDDLLTIAQQAPTGRNFRGLSFGVVDDKDVMADIREKVLQSIEVKAEAETLPEACAGFAKFPTAWREHGVDVLFRQAPHLLVVSAHKDTFTPMQDACIAMTTFELYAQSVGVGTVWNGFAVMTFKEVCVELLPLLGIPEDHELCYIMSFGRSSLRYKRLVDRGSANSYRIA